MKLHSAEISVETKGRGFTDLTARVQDAVASSGVARGTCTAFIEHTSASILITENADPDVRRDLESFFARLVKDGDPLFRHDAEGPDDMPSHVRAALTQTSIVMPIAGGRCALGTWQGLYLFEHRLAPHRRRVSLTIIGE